ncbi:hypothetical protein GPALN_012160 [Globodera pallida]|nr:hypothetical protein GPALN_012160 [Globodera pallida]
MHRWAGPITLPKAGDRATNEKQKVLNVPAVPIVLVHPLMKASFLFVVIPRRHTTWLTGALRMVGDFGMSRGTTRGVGTIFRLNRLAWRGPRPEMTATVSLAVAFGSSSIDFLDDPEDISLDPPPPPAVPPLPPQPAALSAPLVARRGGGGSSNAAAQPVVNERPQRCNAAQNPAVAQHLGKEWPRCPAAQNPNSGCRSTAEQSVLAMHPGISTPGVSLPGPTARSAWKPTGKCLTMGTSLNAYPVSPRETQLHASWTAPRTPSPTI